MGAHKNHRLLVVFIWLTIPNAFSKGGSRGMSSARASSSRFPFTSSRSSQFSSQLFSPAVTSGAFSRSSPLGGSTQFIINPTLPVILNSRSYFWGTAYYVPAANETKMCTVLLNSTDDDQLMALEFENGTKPTEIAFSCQDWEYCSNFECENIIANIAKISVVSLLAILLFAYIFYRIKRSQRKSRKAIGTTVVTQRSSTKPQIIRTQTQSTVVFDEYKEKRNSEAQKQPEASSEPVKRLRPPGGRLPPLKKPS